MFFDVSRYYGVSFWEGWMSSKFKVGEVVITSRKGFWRVVGTKPGKWGELCIVKQIMDGKGRLPKNPREITVSWAQSFSKEDLEDYREADRQKWDDLARVYDLPSDKKIESQIPSDFEMDLGLPPSLVKQSENSDEG